MWYFFVFVFFSICHCFCICPFPHIVTVTIKTGGGGVVWWSRRPLGEAQLPNRTRPQCLQFSLVVHIIVNMIRKDHKDYYHSRGYKSIGTLNSKPFHSLFSFLTTFFSSTSLLVKGKVDIVFVVTILPQPQYDRQFSAFVLLVNITTTTLTAMNARVETGEKLWNYVERPRINIIDTVSMTQAFRCFHSQAIGVLAHHIHMTS